MIKTTQLTKTIREYMEMIDRGDLVLDPEYQREFLYSNSMRDGLIESLLTGIEIPSIYLADHSQDDKTMYNVLDGKQRLTSIYTFIKGTEDLGNNQYKIVKIGKRNKSKLVESGICEDLTGKTFKDLTRDQQQTIYSRTISANLITVSDPKMETYMFGILNTNSTVLSKAALIRALNNSEFPIIKSIDDYNKTTFCKTFNINTRGKSPDAPFLGLLVTAELICQIQNQEPININGAAANVANKFAERCAKNKEIMEESEFEKWCEKLFASLKKGFETYEQICSNSECSNIKSMYSNLGVNSDSVKGVKISYGYLATIVAIFATIKIKNTSRFNLISKNILEVRKDEKFIETISDTTYSTKAFTTRYKMLMQAINDSLADEVSDDQGPRLFSKRQKDEILARNRNDNGGQLICPICNGIIVENGLGEIHFDHIIPYSKGGKTDVDNGQAVHKLCNLNKSNSVIA